MKLKCENTIALSAMIGFVCLVAVNWETITARKPYEPLEPPSELILLPSEEDLSTAITTNVIRSVTNKPMALGFFTNSADGTFLFNGIVASEHLIEIQTNSVTVVGIRFDGNVIYDTNKVTEATQIFWRELSLYIKLIRSHDSETKP